MTEAHLSLDDEFLLDETAALFLILTMYGNYNDNLGSMVVALHLKSGWFVQSHTYRLVTPFQNW